MSVRLIAKNLGLSAAAVSLALNHSPKIPATTRDRVQAEARRLGYRPKAKLKELMNQLRRSRNTEAQAGFAVISLYEDPRPWEHSRHLDRIYRSMRQRADELGYRLEPLWLKAPGMTHARFCSILDTRGIQGLLCFGSPDLEEPFPAALDHYAIVSLGLSIAGSLNRVISHFYNDLRQALRKVAQRGYQRPGLVLSEYEERRSSHVFTSAYLGWCDLHPDTTAPIPILRMNGLEEARLIQWLREHKPDVLLFVQGYEALPSLTSLLQKHGFRIPEDLGLLAVSQILEGTQLSGLQQNQQLMGAWAVELLVARIMNQDFGMPRHPRIELVESEWITGQTLRPDPGSG